MVVTQKRRSTDVRNILLESEKRDVVLNYAQRTYCLETNLIRGLRKRHGLLFILLVLLSSSRACLHGIEPDGANVGVRLN